MPGKIFENLLIFKDGQLIISKVYENLQYFIGSSNMTGAGSTPATAVSCSKKVSNQISFETIKIIKAISQKNITKPNGVYHSSVRYDIKNKPNITEINIGRFPSTNGLFNLFGKYNILDVYYKILLNKKLKLKNFIDNDLGNKVIITRSIDQKPHVLKK